MAKAKVHYMVDCFYGRGDFLIDRRDSYNVVAYDDAEGVREAKTTADWRKPAPDYIHVRRCTQKGDAVVHRSEAKAG